MTKKISALRWAVLAGIFGLGGCVFLLPGYRFSAWVILGIGAVLLAFQLLRMGSTRHPRFCKICRWALSIGLCLGITAAAVTAVPVVKAGSAKEQPTCDYLIVLGAGVNGTVPSLTLRERLEAACTYLQQHPDTVCIVSGGQGPGEEITEAECMTQWLIAKGIDPQRIRPEDKATSTWENLQFSLALIREESQTQSIGILSSEYHLYRAGLMAKDQAMDPILVPAKTGWVSLRVNYYMREIAGVWHYLVFGG